MSVVDDLREGHLPEDFVALLYRQVAIVAKVRYFPPPETYTAWSKDAVHETAHDFLTSHHTHRRLIELAARADDDDSFERLLGTAVLNFLRERGRRTTLGRLVRRLRPLLEADARFTFVPEHQPGAGNVALAKSMNTHPYSGPTDVLRQAARRIADVTVVRWNPNSRREGPIADSKSLLELSAAVLKEADGSMRVPDLAEILASRLGIDPRRVPATTFVDDLDGSVEGDETRLGLIAEGTDLPIELLSLVEAVMAELSERERLVLAWLHETVRVIADRTGLAVSSAGLAKQRVRDKVSKILADLSLEEAEHVAVAARDEARRRAGLDPL